MSLHRLDAHESEGLRGISPWRLAPGPLAAAVTQFAVAAACAAVALIGASAAAGAAALFPLTDAWAHWRAADRIVFETRWPTAGAAIAAAVIAIAAVIGGLRAVITLVAPPAVPMLLAASLGLVAGVATALMVLPLRLRDASDLPGWQCGRSWPMVPLTVALAGAAVLLFDSAWPDLIAAAALVLAYAASVARMLRKLARR